MPEFPPSIDNVRSTNMKINEDLWSHHQYNVLVSFIHHLSYGRVLDHLYNESQIESEFWTYTINAHLLRAIIDWCMVFGTDSNKIHWKKVVTDEQYQGDFRCHLRNVAGLTKEQIDEIWSKMTSFRNNYVAHRTASYSYPDVPYMDTALIIATNYDDWFREKLDASFEEPSLKERYDRLMRTSEGSFRALIDCGPTIDQEYEGKPPCKT